MKVTLFVLAFVLLISGADVAAAGSFSYLPSDHWSYGAVEQLREAGLLANYESIDRLNRYELALIVARVIQFLSHQEVTSAHRFGVSKDVLLSDLIHRYNADVSQPKRVSQEDANLLLDLALEVENELEVLGYALLDNGQRADLPNTPVFQRAESVFLAEKKLIFREETLHSTMKATDEVAEQSGEKPLPVAQSDLTEEKVDLASGEAVSKALWIPNLPSVSILNTVDEFRLYDPPKLESTSLRSDLFGETKTNKVIDGLIPLNDVFSFDVAYLEDHRPEADKETGVAVLGGTLALAPNVSVMGSYTQNIDEDAEGAAVELGASIRLGEVEVGGSYRSMEPGYRPLDSEEKTGGGSGYGVSLKVGDLSVSTGRDHILRLEEDRTNMTTKTRLDLSYGFANSVLLSAGISQEDSEFKTVAELGVPTKTSLGVEVPIPQGRLRIDVSSEWLLSGNGELNEEGAVVTAAELQEKPLESGARKTASVGLSYLLENEASFQLNYKLIDFNSVDRDLEEQTTNRATAEFSVKF